ncbi:hypothetical protein COJ46_18140 [Bacillus sp. AFS077874]|nr:hypothetical protein COJ46_18140 [Bacillus sp. AFS077874]
MRALAKEFGFKKRSNCLFNKVGDFFVVGVYYTNFTDDTEISISMKCNIKPFSHDDLFWEVLKYKKMQKNL